MFKDGQIVITSDLRKNAVIKEISSRMLNVKVYGFKEIIKLYYFDYDVETILYIMDKYNVKGEIAKIYIENLYFIRDKNYKSQKLQFLQNLKNELLDKNLLKINKMFRNFLKNKEILIYELPISKEVKILLDELSLENKVIIETINEGDYQHKVFQLETIEKEVYYVVNEICALIKKGIKPEKIFITNVFGEYKKVIKKVFKMFNVLVNFALQEKIFGTFIVKKFLELYKDNSIEVVLEKLKEYLVVPKDYEIYNKIIEIINKYTFVQDRKGVYDLIKLDLKKATLDSYRIKNAISEINLGERTIYDDEYVFCFSFNQGVLPVNYKDEEYLNDLECDELGISKTVDKNNLEKERIVNEFKRIKNLVITYKVFDDGVETNLSSLNDIINYQVIVEDKVELSNSNLYNKIELARLLDDYYKYGIKSDLLKDLSGHYKDMDYKGYNHVFKGISKEDLKEYLDNKLVLSYSSLDKYYRCPFSYYIGNILKLNIFEETFYQLVGNLFHAILEKFSSSKLSYEELWDNEIKVIESKHQFTNKEVFFLKKLKEELKFIIETIEEQEKFTSLHDELHEERVYVSLPDEMKITFTGIIDKIKYKKENNETIIAIIDYKTGNPNLDLTMVPYGIGMQLPVYLYLAKNSEKLENVKVAGFYLQKVLNNEVVVDNVHSYEQLKRKNLLLQGFSNEDISILKEFDSSYMESNIIKSMKVKNDNSFYSYSKVLSSEKMDNLANLAKRKILEGAMLISNGKFDIAPKKQDKVNYGCSLCKFKDICFHINDDIKELKKLDIEDVVGDINGVDGRTESSNI